MLSSKTESNDEKIVSPGLKNLNELLEKFKENEKRQQVFINYLFVNSV